MLNNQKNCSVLLVKGNPMSSRGWEDPIKEEWVGWYLHSEPGPKGPIRSSVLWLRYFLSSSGPSAPSSGDRDTAHIYTLTFFMSFCIFFLLCHSWTKILCVKLNTSRYLRKSSLISTFIFVTCSLLWPNLWTVALVKLLIDCMWAFAPLKQPEVQFVAGYKC